MNWDELISALDGVPVLHGALCRSRAPLFDSTSDNPEVPAQRAARIAVAQGICQICPALEPCREWAAGTEPVELSGVIGGKLHESTVTPIGLDSQRTIVEALRGREESTAADVAKTLGVSKNTASAALRRAYMAGAITKLAIGVYGPGVASIQAVGA